MSSTTDSDTTEQPSESSDRELTTDSTIRVEISSNSTIAPVTDSRELGEAHDIVRTRRATSQPFDITFKKKPGVYEVYSENSGQYYDVNVVAHECSCPDPGYCKHLRTVRLSLAFHEIPTPDGRLPKRK